MQHDTAINSTAGVAPTPGPGGEVFRLTFPATFGQVRKAIKSAVRALQVTGLPDEDLSTVEIVLAEALNNVAEHAYPVDAIGDVTMILRHRRTSIMVEVRDNGRPLPGGRAPAGGHPADEPGAGVMPEGGYGWFLIRELARDMIYDRRDGQNYLVFRIAVSADAG